MAQNENQPRDCYDESTGLREASYAPSTRSTSLDALLTESLDSLAVHMRNALPPEDLEERLLARAAKQGLLGSVGTPCASPKRETVTFGGLLHSIPRWGWASLATAAVVGLFLVSLPEAPPPPAALTPRIASIIIPAMSNGQQGEAPLQTGKRENREAQPSRQALIARATKRISPAPAKLETAVAEGSDAPQPLYSEFVPLEFASVYPAGEALQTVRVRMDAEDFLRLGLPGSAITRATQLVRNDRVTADFLVGDDGSPRAIRLVSMNE